MNNVICLKCVRDSIIEHAYWCDLHPENRPETPQEPAQRGFLDESDHEAERAVELAHIVYNALQRDSERSRPHGADAHQAENQAW